MKLLKVLIIFALIVFPFGELLRFEVGNNIVLKPLDIVVGMAAIWFVIFKLLSSRATRGSREISRNRVTQWYEIPRLRYRFARNDILWPLLLFAAIGFFSLLINLTWLKPNEFFVSILYLFRWVSYGLFLIIVPQFDKKFKEKIVYVLFFDGLVILLLGYLQYFFFNSLKSLYYLGWDEHMHRMFGTFFDPNFAGAFFVLYFLFIGGLLLSNQPKPFINEDFLRIRNSLVPRSNSLTIKKFYLFTSFILSIVLFFTLIAVFLTFSRAALLMLVVGSVVFLFLIQRKKLILVLVAALVLFVVVASPKFYDENMNLFRTNSSSARLANYSLALRVIGDHPLVGIGFNSYRYTKQLYGLDHDWTHASSHADAGVDNSLLFVLATTGIIGFIAYCSLLIIILRKSYSLYKKNGNILSVVVIASVIGLSFHSLFINSLFFPALLFWIYMLIGLTKK